MLSTISNLWQLKNYNLIKFDVFFSIAFLILGPFLIINLLSQNNYYTFFYQFFIPESISWACDKGFFFPESPILEYGRFATGSVFTFDCSVLSSVKFLDQTGFYYKIQPYLTWLVAICWYIFGASYESLLPISYALYGAYISGVFLLCRQFLNPIFSCAIAIFIAVSPLSAYMAIELRDFSKAPFFIWSLYFLIKTVRSTNCSHRIFFVTLTSSVIALGYGFRSDLIVMVPFGFVFILTYLLIEYCKSNKRNISQFYILPIFVLTFVAVAYPIWSNISFGGYSGTFVMQGMSEPFRIESNISKANYTTGWQYSDELTLSSVAAVLSTKNPNWDTVEQANIPGITTSNSFQQSTEYMVSWADIFIGDLFTQSMKSVGWILSFPNFLSRPHPLPSPVWKKSIHNHQVFKKTLSIYEYLSREWFVYVGIVGFISLIYLSYIKSPAESVSLLILLTMLFSYTGLQFSLRHVFHLEFFWLLFLFSIFSAAPKIINNFKKFSIVIGIVSALLIFIVSAYYLALAYQHTILSSEVEKLLSLPQSEVQTLRETREDGNIYLRVPIPDDYRNLVFGKVDSMTPTIYLKGVQWDVRARADRLLINIDDENCNLDDIHIYGKYAHTPDTWQPLDIHMTYKKDRVPGEAQIIFPAFYRGSQYFDGLLIPQEAAGCQITIKKIIGESRLPIFFSANLKNRQIIGSLHKGFGGLSTKLDDSTIIKTVVVK